LHGSISYRYLVPCIRVYKILFFYYLRAIFRHFGLFSHILLLFSKQATNWPSSLIFGTKTLRFLSKMLIFHYYEAFFTIMEYFPFFLVFTLHRADHCSLALCLFLLFLNLPKLPQNCKKCYVFITRWEVEKQQR